ncbi:MULTISPECIES: hypothetical protein [Acinetobacter]|jgi:hypothetical protein|uniref:Uncharacterized protein n=2 Tax=Acinetobacter calcoaceticus/baumannii complex TaxID=909768 RepID=A0A1E3M5H0_ACIBA|nr:MULTISPECIES: hypothetical protein [Acinetobacter calcoaceticus/baumannii complex]CAH1090774.1 Uncharacterised protein [Acinetobacter phage MD-2021a]AKQ28710.1 hypothetical protein ACX60_18320 [Acinetobacter baumannii]APP30798.1 hypothetical protein AUO97_08225 [Acinetobacter baumannii]APX49267.1 hypothetical protein AT570_08220 [Acinetobacter baumannii]ARG33492.1 hypothetical protein B7L46_00495 [Acinetobacter baumannii]
MAKKLPPHIVDALEALEENEIESASLNALRLRAWLYFIRFLSSFQTNYETKNPYSSIQFTHHQASLFAFGIDDKNPENFLLFAQENDFWWLSEIGIEYFTFIEKFLIIKFLPLNYVNLNLSSENKIRIPSLTISIPLSDMYYDHLQQYIPAFKNAYIGKIGPSPAGINKWNISEFSNLPIPVRPQLTPINRQHALSNKTSFL